ncbi:MAG: hypothetical protein WBM44_05195 [Waterburya sp.]
MKTQIITLQFPSFGNPNAEREIEITFKFEAGIVTWRNRVFKVNERLIAVSKVYDDKGFGNFDYEYQTSVISVEETIKLMMKTVQSYKQPNQAINFLNELVGTVLITTNTTRLTVKIIAMVRRTTIAGTVVKKERQTI